MLYLSIAFIALMVAIGGKRGLHSLFALCLNVMILTGLLTLISWSFNPLILTILASLMISNVILFTQNGNNVKTVSSFMAILLVVGLMIGFTLVVSYKAKLGGLNELIQGELMSFGMSANMNLNMFHMAIAMIITGLMGASTDTSISISSAVYEVYRNNPQMTRKDLYKSGMHMGKDILGTTVNTLYFAYLGGAMTLFIYYKRFNYSFLDMINSKAFLQETLYILFGAISCVLIIPITAAMVAYVITHPHKFAKHLEDDVLLSKAPQDPT